MEKHSSHHMVAGVSGFLVAVTKERDRDGMPTRKEIHA